MVMECCFRFYEMSHLINFIHFFLHLFVVRRQIGPADAREFSRRCNFRFRKQSLPSRAVATIPGHIECRITGGLNVTRGKLLVYSLEKQHYI